MRKLFLVFIFTTNVILAKTQDTTLSDQFQTLASELESKYSDRPGIKVAILEFRTSEDKTIPLNNFCCQEIAQSLKNSMNFKLMDPIIYANIAKEKPWSIHAANNYEFMDDLGRIFMEKSGDVPVAYIYGIITDNQKSITITAYLSSMGINEAKAVASITIDANEKTNELLGKK
jgi:hypothetical protein